MGIVKGNACLLPILAIENGEKEIAHSKRKAVPQRRVAENKKVKKTLVSGAKRNDGGKKNVCAFELKKMFGS